MASLPWFGTRCVLGSRTSENAGGRGQEGLLKLPVRNAIGSDFMVPEIRRGQVTDHTRLRLPAALCRQPAPCTTAADTLWEMGECAHWGRFPH